MTLSGPFSCPHDLANADPPLPAITPLMNFILGFSFIFFLGTLVEYWVHRAQHAGYLNSKIHANHHRHGKGQGVLGEFLDYVLGTVALMWIGFLVSVEAGIGTVCGGLFYAAFAAYAHQAQHERPMIVFWQRKPVHYLHHRHNSWHSNFGIACGFWDRIFGTFEDHLYPDQSCVPLRSWRDFFSIRWRGFSEPGIRPFRAPKKKS